MMNDGGESQLRFKEDAKLFNQVFLNLVRPREEVFCFSPPRTCLTAEPTAELDRLFDFYVERGFAQRLEYQEKLMTRRLRTVFNAKKIVDLTEHTFVSDFCHAHFPFVRQVGDRYVRAIHPLNLDKTDTPKIVEHADRLKQVYFVAGTMHAPSVHAEPVAGVAAFSTLAVVPVRPAAEAACLRTVEVPPAVFFADAIERGRTGA